MKTWTFVVILLTLYISLSSSDHLKLVTKDEFKQIIQTNKYVLVLFIYDMETCQRCRTADKEMEKVDTQPDLYDQEIIKIKCEDPGMAMDHGVSTVPQVVFFRNGVPALFNHVTEKGSLRITADGVNAFIEEAQEVSLHTLTDDSFEHLTQAATGATTGDWFVIFYKDSCKSYLSAVEGAGVKLRHRMNVAKINMDENPGLVNRFKITECPTSYFFRQGRMYHYFSEDVNYYQVDSILSFISSWYKNVKAQPVPVDPSTFDIITDGIADYLKENLHGPNCTKFLVIFGVVMAIVSLILSIAVVMCRGRSKDTKAE